MKAAIYDDFHAPIEVREIPDPIPAPGDAVVRVMATGVCRSDWHGWSGHDPDIHPPQVPGHEFAGVIEALGRDVRGWRIGDRVTAPFVCACGECPECRGGDHQVCRRQEQPGFTYAGSFAEFVVVKRADVNLVALPEAVDDVSAASLGCRFATSFRAVVDQGRVRPGEWVAVHGCGGVGLAAVMIAHAVGARVVGIDVKPAALEMARSLGAEEVLDAAAGIDVPEAVRDLTGGGALVSLDALGHPHTCQNSIACLRRRGRHVQVGLTLAAHSRPPIPMDRVIAHELEILGSHGMAAHRYPALLAMIAAGRVNPARLVDRRVSLADGAEFLPRMDSAPSTGVVIIDRF